MSTLKSRQALQDTNHFIAENLQKSSSELKADYEQLVADLQPVTSQPVQPAPHRQVTFVTVVVKTIITKVMTVLVKRSPTV